MISVEPIEKDIFFQIEMLICEKFREIQEVISLRKDILLSELGILREEHRSKYKIRSKSIEGLEMLQSQMENIIVQDNVTSQFYTRQLSDIRSEIENTQKSIPTPNIKLKCDIEALLTAVRCFGEVLEVSPVKVVPLRPSPPLVPRPKPISERASFDYESKSNPSRSFALRGSCQGYLKTPRAVHYDDTGNRIFVADGGNNKIVIYSPKGDFISEFGHMELRNPCGVVVSESFCYVTDMTLNIICKFELSMFRLLSVSRQNELREPKGIALDQSADELYVVDRNKGNRIWVYNTEPSFERVFDTQILNSPRDVKVTSENVFVLDSSVFCLHCFTKQGVKLQSIIQQPESIESPYFFTLTRDGNFLLGGQWDGFLKVFSQQGKLIHSVGTSSLSKECPKMVRGVCVTADDDIVCGFYHGNYAMNLY